jgi:regulator of sigma E protease
MRNAGGTELVLALDGGRELRLDVHSDALRERLMAAEAVQPYLPAVVSTVVADRPAGRDGLTVGDSIVAIDGVPVTQWYDLTGLIEARPDAPVRLGVVRAGSPVEIATRTYADTLPADSAGIVRVVGRLGITPRIVVESERYTLGGALGAGWNQTVESSTQIVRTVRGLFSGRVAGRELGGPILIGQLAGQSARLGLDYFLGFMALISVNLAVLNLLPIPVLDGGQFVFLVAEAVLRKPLPLKLRERLTAVGMVLILLLMVFAFSNDIRRVIGI